MKGFSMASTLDFIPTVAPDVDSRQTFFRSSLRRIGRGIGRLFRGIGQVPVMSDLWAYEDDVMVDTSSGEIVYASSAAQSTDPEIRALATGRPPEKTFPWGTVLLVTAGIAVAGGVGYMALRHR